MKKQIPAQDATIHEFDELIKRFEKRMQEFVKNITNQIRESEANLVRNIKADLKQMTENLTKDIRSFSNNNKIEDKEILYCNKKDNENNMSLTDEEVKKIVDDSLEEYKKREACKKSMDGLMSQEDIDRLLGCGE